MKRQILILMLLLITASSIHSQVTQEWANLYFNSTKNVEGKVITLDSTYFNILE